MRTLTRPMFNMGGPIKQGIMHGIREPYKGGGKAALVGNPVYPRTGGREHHALPLLAAPAAWTAARAAATRLAPQALRGIKRMFGPTTPASATRGKHFVSGASGSYSPVTMNPSKFNPNWLGRDPLIQGANWARKSIFNPTTGGLAAKAARVVASPSTIIGGVAWYMWPDGKERTEPPTGIMKPGGYPQADKKTKQAQAEFAKAQREDRVQKYLKMMGYDRAKKTAIADALIDASKIVGDRGTLDLKNIGTDLINPIIQATSKRLDKPDQIREAVGLMATKAEIEKDLEDPSIKALRLEQLKELRGGFEKDIGDFILSAKGGKVKKDALEQFARVKAKEHGETFTVVDEGTTIPEGGSGYYMLEDKIFRVVDGASQQVV